VQVSGLGREVQVRTPLRGSFYPDEV